MLRVIAIYLASVNIIAFVLCGLDKWKAQHGARRIRERTLLCFAAGFGSVGLFCGMVLFHHKTKDKAFMPWVPLMLPVQAALLAWGYKLLYL